MRRPKERRGTMKIDKNLKRRRKAGEIIKMKIKEESKSKKVSMHEIKRRKGKEHSDIIPLHLEV